MTVDITQTLDNRTLVAVEVAFRQASDNTDSSFLITVTGNAMNKVLVHLFAFAVSGQAVSSGTSHVRPVSANNIDYEYTETVDGLTIVNYTGPGVDVIIPTEIDGKPVIAIGDNAFALNGDLTSVAIPNSVTSIGHYAFSLCQNLTNATIPNTVTSIGAGALLGCYSLTSVTIPNSVTFIGANAFSCCSSLTNVVIPNSISSIGVGTFSDCTSLTSVTIPDGVTSIGVEAFSSGSSLTNIHVNIDNSIFSSVDGILFNKDQSELMQYPAGKQGFLYVIPNSVTSIQSGAFSSCRNLTSVTIPTSVISMGQIPFIFCTSLQGLYFMGDAPQPADIRLGFSLSATVYYRRGTQGWGSTFGELPTALWPPSIESHLRIIDDRLLFEISGPPGDVVVIEANTHLGR